MGARIRQGEALDSDGWDSTPAIDKVRERGAERCLGVKQARTRNACNAFLDSNHIVQAVVAKVAFKILERDGVRFESEHTATGTHRLRKVVRAHTGIRSDVENDIAWLRRAPVVVRFNGVRFLRRPRKPELESVMSIRMLRWPRIIDNTVSPDDGSPVRIKVRRDLLRICEM
jgi:hypothetical protein